MFNDDLKTLINDVLNERERERVETPSSPYKLSPDKSSPGNDKSTTTSIYEQAQSTQGSVEETKPQTAAKT